MSIFEKTKQSIITNRTLSGIIFGIYNRLPFNNTISRKRGNRVIIKKGCYLRNNRIKFYHSKNSEVIIEPGARLVNCSIIINENCNKIHIKSDAFLNGCIIEIHENENIFSLGHRSSANSSVFWLGESTKLIIGNNTHIAYGGRFRTNDGHSLCNEFGKRINKAKDIIIGDHCWIGLNTVCSKGTVLQPETIVSASSLINKEYQKGNIILGGIPAKVLRENIKWETWIMPFED